MSNATNDNQPCNKVGESSGRSVANVPVSPNLRVAISV